MYSKLHDVIRQYDTDHIIFFEPTVIFTSVSYTYTYVSFNLFSISIAPSEEILIYRIN